MQIPETEIIVSKEGAEILRKTVRPSDYVIGREPNCDVQVDVDLVSCRNAQLTVNFDHSLIENLRSGTRAYVNGQPVTEVSRFQPEIFVKRNRNPYFPNKLHGKISEV